MILAVIILIALLIESIIVNIYLVKRMLLRDKYYMAEKHMMISQAKALQVLLLAEKERSKRQISSGEYDIEQRCVNADNGLYSAINILDFWRKEEN